MEPSPRVSHRDYRLELNIQYGHFHLKAPCGTLFNNGKIYLLILLTSLSSGLSWHEACLMDMKWRLESPLSYCWLIPGTLRNDPIFLKLGLPKDTFTINKAEQQKTVLTILDTGRDGYQWNQQTQASVYPQKDFVFHATIFLCVKHCHQNQASSGHGVHGEGHQGQGGVPQLVVSGACSPVFAGRGKREGREDKSVTASTFSVSGIHWCCQAPGPS